MGNRIIGRFEDEVSEITSEELNMVNKALDYILKEAKSKPSAFTASICKLGRNEFVNSKSNQEADVEEKEFEKYRYFKEYTICWEPSDALGPFHHIRFFKMEYIPITGELTICSELDSLSLAKTSPNSASYFEGKYFVGSNNTESILSIRKRFVAIYNIVNKYHEEFIPRKRQEEATNHFCNLFPQIVDDIILSEIASDKEGND